MRLRPARVQVISPGRWYCYGILFNLGCGGGALAAAAGHALVIGRQLQFPSQLHDHYDANGNNRPLIKRTVLCRGWATSPLNQNSRPSPVLLTNRQVQLGHVTHSAATGAGAALSRVAEAPDYASCSLLSGCRSRCACEPLRQTAPNIDPVTSRCGRAGQGQRPAEERCAGAPSAAERRGRSPIPPRRRPSLLITRRHLGAMRRFAQKMCPNWGQGGWPHQAFWRQRGAPAGGGAS